MQNASSEWDMGSNALTGSTRAKHFLRRYLNTHWTKLCIFQSSSQLDLTVLLQALFIHCSFKYSIYEWRLCSFSFPVLLQIASAMLICAHVSLPGNLYALFVSKCGGRNVRHRMIFCSNVATDPQT